MILDRTHTPELKPISKIAFVNPICLPLGGKRKLFWMKQVPDETVRVEIYFDAGAIRGEKTIAGITNALLFSGTATKSSREIHEELDQLGAYIDQEVAQEKASVSVYCLRKNVKEVLHLVHHAILEATFPQQELEDVLREKKQKLLVSMEKVGFLARQQFQKQLFHGEENYARFSEPKDFDSIDQALLKEFHAKHYLKGLHSVVVVGNLDQDVIELMQELFTPWAQEKEENYVRELNPKKGQLVIPKKGAIQTAIRMGIPLFNKKHPDFIDFQVLQTILGDYFGSRLMSNIREDKGFTYGIGCALAEMNELGYFIIVTEVACEVAEATLKEIKFELERLQNELVDEKELSLVKNYLLGQMLKSADGPNAMMDLFIGVERHGLDLDFYQTYMTKVQAITQERLQELAKKYLDWSNFIRIEVGISN